MSDREFVLTDGNKYIRSNLDNKYVTTSNLSLADIFCTQKAADNVRLNSLSKALSRLVFVAEIIDGKIIQCNSPRPRKVEKITNGEYIFTGENTFKDTKWHNGFDGLLSLFSDATKRINELSQEMSDIEAEIVDIEHYIEFTNLNARDGYKIYKKLRECLRKRRCIKDEQRVVNVINDNYSATSQIQNIVKVLDMGSFRHYKPRVLVDLFKNGLNGGN